MATVTEQPTCGQDLQSVGYVVWQEGDQLQGLKGIRPTDTTAFSSHNSFAASVALTVMCATRSQSHKVSLTDP